MSGAFTYSRGFTLIELLIVVAILGILASLIAPTLGGERRIGLQTEADRLTRLIEAARVESMAGGEQWGLRLLARGYVFERYDGERKQWRRVEDEVRDLYELPEDLDLLLKVESGRASFPQSNKSPQILILSSGEITPFSVQIFSISGQESCRVDCNGIERTRFSCA